MRALKYSFINYVFLHPVKLFFVGVMRNSARALSKSNGDENYWLSGLILTIFCLFEKRTRGSKQSNIHLQPAKPKIIIGGTTTDENYSNKQTKQRTQTESIGSP